MKHTWNSSLWHTQSDLKTSSCLWLLLLLFLLKTNCFHALLIWCSLDTWYTFSESHFAPCLSVFLSQSLPLKNRLRSLAEPLDLSLGPNILLFPAVFQITEPSSCHLQGHCRQSSLRLQIPYYDIPTCWSNLALPARLLHTHPISCLLLGQLSICYDSRNCTVPTIDHNVASESNAWLTCYRN